MKVEIPECWVNTTLGDILKLKNGFAYKSKDFSESGIPVIRISNIKDKEVSTAGAVRVPDHLKNENFIVRHGDILVAMSGATTGKYGIYKGQELALQNQRVGNFVPYSNEIQKKFIFYLLGSLKKVIEEKAYGAAQPNISSRMIESLDILLPPLQEQKRIVAKLDALFGHLDSLNARLDRIPELIKNFRQQVLKLAMSGKLTEKWRKEKGIGLWSKSKIGELFEVKTGATPKRGTQKYYENASIPWIKSGLVKNELIFEADEYITQEAIEETNAKLFPIDTLLVAMYGEGKTRGQVGWMKIEAATNQAIAALVNTEMGLTTRSYIYYFCLSQYNFIRAKAEGGNQPNLNLTKIKNWEIELPTEQEQKEIVSRVKELFELIDEAEKSYNLLKEKIEKLPQAILNKAFKGELVPQDPNDEPASVLLERIRNEKEVKKQSPKKSSSPKSSRKQAGSRAAKKPTSTGTIKVRPKVSGKVTAKIGDTAPKSGELELFLLSQEYSVFKAIQSNLTKKSFDFDELMKSVKLDYDQVWDELYDLLRYTEAGMRPGIVQKFDLKKNKVLFEWKGINES